MSEKQCSAAFLQAFRTGCGGIIRVCACGKTHYNDVDECFYDAATSLERLRNNYKQNPTKYMPHDGDVMTMSFFGTEVVIGCDCDTAINIEKKLLNERGALGEYFRRTAEAKVKEVESYQAVVNVFKNNNENFPFKANEYGGMVVDRQSAEFTLLIYDSNGVLVKIDCEESGWVEREDGEQFLEVQLKNEIKPTGKGY